MYLNYMSVNYVDCFEILTFINTVSCPGDSIDLPVITVLVNSHLDLHEHFCFQNDLDDPERGMIFVCSATHKTKVSLENCFLFNCNYAVYVK